MALLDIPSVGGLETLEDVKKYLHRMDRDLRYLLGGNLNSKNVSELGGWTIDDVSLVSSSGNVGMSSEETSFTDVRLWAGSSYTLRETAPFRVLEDGSLVASKASITGDIHMTTGSISWGGAGVPAPTPQDVGALATSSPMLTYIGPTGIYTGTIFANQIFAGTLTGFTIQTAFSGQRVMLDTGGLHSYDANGVERIAIRAGLGYGYHELTFLDQSAIKTGIVSGANNTFNVGSSGSVPMILGGGNVGIYIDAATPFVDFQHRQIRNFNGTAKFA